jgi:hypothetical protein
MKGVGGREGGVGGREGGVGGRERGEGGREERREESKKILYKKQSKRENILNKTAQIKHQYLKIK